jgi:hypothetical protein
MSRQSNTEPLAGPAQFAEDVHQQPGLEPLMSIEDTARVLGGMHPKTLMRMARSREVPAIKIGRFWFFRATSLNEWIELCSIRPSVPCHKELSK